MSKKTSKKNTIGNLKKVKGAYQGKVPQKGLNLTVTSQTGLPSFVDKKFPKILAALDEMFGKKTRANKTTLAQMNRAAQFSCTFPLVAVYFATLNRKTAKFYYYDIAEIDGERQPSLEEDRIKKHVSCMDQKTFLPSGRICLVYIEECGCIFKIDGNGRSFALLLLVGDELDYEIPMQYHIYYVKTITDASSLYNSFDQRNSSRKKGQQQEIQLKNSGLEYLKDHHSRTFLTQAQKALLLMEERYKYAHLSIDERPRRYDENEQSRICVEYADLLQKAEQILGTLDSTTCIWKAPDVFAFMLYTIDQCWDNDNMDAMLTFWGMLLNERQTSLDAKKSKMAAMIQQVYQKMSLYDKNKDKWPMPWKKYGINSRPAPSVCYRALALYVTQAWNAFMKDKPLQKLRYHKNLKEMPMPIIPEE